MFTVFLLEFKTNQTELHRRATYFRLVKLLKKLDQWIAVSFTAIGKSLISSGAGIINHYQIVQYKY